MARISVSPWFAAMLILLRTALPAEAFYTFLLATAIHETGHLLCIYFTGARVTSLALSFGGAVLHTTPLSYPQEMVCALGGPVSSLLLLLCRSRLHWLGFWGGVQGLYNLLAVYPLDGGRILRAALAMSLPPERAFPISIAMSGSILLLIPAAGFLLGGGRGLAPLFWVLWLRLILLMLPCFVRNSEI